MYIVPIAWLYVALMMAVAEATNTTGTVLGGIITFVLYGLLPVGLVVYVMGAPGRRQAIEARERAELATTQATSALQPNAGSHAPGDAVAAERKEV
jgi:mannose/fructose/N-acetylgalactosamine-specific phosphotransferase system component IID